MKTFHQFLEEGKKKKKVEQIIKRVEKDVKKQVKENPHQEPVRIIAPAIPGTTATPEQIQALIQMNRSYVKDLKRRQNS